jgi:hypothetical protein
MNTTERYVAILQHFSVEENVVAFMRTTEWSCYLYDNFEVSPNDVTEEFWYDHMMKRAAEAWTKLKSKRRAKLVDQTFDKYEKRNMRDNAHFLEV